MVIHIPGSLASSGASSVTARNVVLLEIMATVYDHRTLPVLTISFSAVYATRLDVDLIYTHNQHA